MPTPPKKKKKKQSRAEPLTNQEIAKYLHELGQAARRNAQGITALATRIEIKGIEENRSDDEIPF